MGHLNFRASDQRMKEYSLHSRAVPIHPSFNTQTDFKEADEACVADRWRARRFLGSILTLFLLAAALPSTLAATSPPELLWTTSIGARLFAVDEATNVYANASGNVIKMTGAGVPFQTNAVCPLPGLAQRDPDGNLYFSGVMFGPQDFGGIVLLSGAVFYLAKYSAEGSLLWATNFGPSPAGLRGAAVDDLVLDSAGNLLIGHRHNFSTTDFTPRASRFNPSGSLSWSIDLPKKSWATTTGRVRLTSVTPTNGYAITYIGNAGFNGTLARFDDAGVATELTNWPSTYQQIPAAVGARTAVNSFGEIYNVEGIPSTGIILKKRQGNGAPLPLFHVLGGTAWVAGPDQFDGVHVGTDTMQLTRYDYDCNLVWTLNLPSNCEELILDSHGNRFLLLSGGSVARLGHETLSAPQITVAPVGTTVFHGSNVTLSVTASGTTPIRYRWFQGANAVEGGTNATLNLLDPSPNKSGAYVVVVSNLVGSLTSTPVQVRIKSVQLYRGEQMLTNGTYTFLSPPTLAVRSAFTNGSIFYTIDGSTPSFTGTPYNGPFTVASNVTVRAIGYSADFGQSEEADRVTVVIPPTYSLTATTVGPGSINLNPSGGAYVSSTVVTATATPGPGWTFLYWSGDAFGSSPSVSVTLDRDKSIKAVFGTTVATTVTGGGQVQPTGGLYAYGSVIRFTAIPQAGNYFGVWGNAASGNSNPLYFSVTNANPTISSLFAALPAGQEALTVLIYGSGSVNVNPPGNSFAAGQSVALTAVPDAGQRFLNWSGDATGAQNPLSLTMNQSRVVTAIFTSWPLLVPSPPPLNSQGFEFRLLSETGSTYQVQTSADLYGWTNLAVVTNVTGEVFFMDSGATNLSRRFYRTIAWP